MRNLDELFTALANSDFRSKQHLKGKDLQYLHDKGLPLILDHARDFIAKRLAPAKIANDGKQTPFRGHPVFVGQHATACCCRECLHKWHGIEPGRELTAKEQDYLIEVLARWLCMEEKLPRKQKSTKRRQMTLPGFWAETEYLSIGQDVVSHLSAHHKLNLAIGQGTEFCLQRQGNARENIDQFRIEMATAVVPE